jgi:hypothetical protein
MTDKLINISKNLIFRFYTLVAGQLVIQNNLIHLILKKKKLNLNQQ